MEIEKNVGWYTAIESELGLPNRRCTQMFY